MLSMSFLMLLSILIIITLNSISNKLLASTSFSSFSGEFSRSFFLLGLFLCLPILAACFCLYVLDRSAKTLVHHMSDTACDWPWATCLELSEIHSSDLLWSVVARCVQKQTMLSTKVSFYQHQARREGQLKSQSSQRFTMACRLSDRLNW